MKKPEHTTIYFMILYKVLSLKMYSTIEKDKFYIGVVIPTCKSTYIFWRLPLGECKLETSLVYIAR